MDLSTCFPWLSQKRSRVADAEEYIKEDDSRQSSQRIQEPSHDSDLIERQDIIMRTLNQSSTTSSYEALLGGVLLSRDIPLRGNFNLDCEIELEIGKILNVFKYWRVYKAKWKTHDQDVVVKVLWPNSPTQAIEYLCQEIAVLCRADSEYIVKCLGVCQKLPTLCLITEYVPNGDLDKFVHNRLDKIPEREILRIAYQIAKGLGDIHPGVIHLNFKPKHVLFDEHYNVKLSGFCFSRMRENAEGVAERGTVGTVPYIAPEALEQTATVDEKCDIYAFGVILWEMYTRDYPWKFYDQIQITYQVIINKNRPEIPDDCPPYLKNLINKCWAQNPKDRPSAEEIQSYIKQISMRMNFGQINQIIKDIPQVSSGEGGHLSRSVSSSEDLFQDTKIQRKIQQKFKQDNEQQRITTQAAPQQSILITPDVPLNGNFDIDYETELKIEEQLGMGGFGRVCKAKWLTHGWDVAVKELHPQKLTKSGLTLLCQEIEVHCKLPDHPNLIKCYGACLKPPVYCLVLEYAKNGDLGRFIHDSEQRPPEEQILGIAFQIAEGLAKLHPTIVHRDLKPQNVLLDENFDVKLADFGLAKMKSNTYLTLQTMNPGTAAYMAPEVLQGKEKVNEKCDIYALGIILWEMYTKQQPWKELSHFQIICKVLVEKRRPDIPDDYPEYLKSLTEKCWAQDPRDRPSVGEVQDTIKHNLRRIKRQRQENLQESPLAKFREEIQSKSNKRDFRLDSLGQDPVSFPASESIKSAAILDSTHIRSDTAGFSSSC